VVVGLLWGVVGMGREEVLVGVVGGMWLKGWVWLAMAVVIVCGSVEVVEDADCGCGCC